MAALSDRQPRGMRRTRRQRKATRKHPDRLTDVVCRQSIRQAVTKRQQRRSHHSCINTRKSSGILCGDCSGPGKTGRSTTESSPIVHLLIARNSPGCLHLSARCRVCRTVVSMYGCGPFDRGSIPRTPNSFAFFLFRPLLSLFSSANPIRS